MALSAGLTASMRSSVAAISSAAPSLPAASAAERALASSVGGVAHLVTSVQIRV